MRPLDLGELFATLTGQLEDAYGIAVEGQRPGLSQDEAHVFVQLLQRQFVRMAVTFDRIIAS